MKLESIFLQLLTNFFFICEFGLETNESILGLLEFLITVSFTFNYIILFYFNAGTALLFGLEKMITILLKIYFVLETILTENEFSMTSWNHKIMNLNKPLESKLISKKILLNYFMFWFCNPSMLCLN